MDKRSDDGDNRSSGRSIRSQEVASDRRLTHVVENVFSGDGFLSDATLCEGDVLWNGFVQVMADLRGRMSAVTSVVKTHQDKSSEDVR